MFSSLVRSLLAIPRKVEPGATFPAGRGGTRGVALHRRPLGRDDAEQRRVSRSVPSREDLVVAQDAVLLRAQPLDRRARLEVEEVGAELDGDAAERLERVRQQQQLALGIYARPLRALRVPRVADHNRRCSASTLK